MHTSHPAVREKAPSTFQIPAVKFFCFSARCGWLKKTHVSSAKQRYSQQGTKHNSDSKMPVTMHE